MKSFMMILPLYMHVFAQIYMPILYIKLYLSRSLCIRIGILLICRMYKDFATHTIGLVMHIHFSFILHYVHPVQKMRVPVSAFLGIFICSKVSLFSVGLTSR